MSRDTCVLWTWLQSALKLITPKMTNEYISREFETMIINGEESCILWEVFNTEARIDGQ